MSISHCRLLAPAILLIASLSTHAQVSVQTTVIATGGAGAANTAMHLTGTFGQPIIGHVSTPRRDLFQGFWLAHANDLPSSADVLVEGESAMQLRCIPNPISRSATVHAILPRVEITTLTLHDLLGRKILSLIDAEQTNGSLVFELACGELAEGHYRLVLTAGQDHISLPVEIVR